MMIVTCYTSIIVFNDSWYHVYKRCAEDRSINRVRSRQLERTHPNAALKTRPLGTAHHQYYSYSLLGFAAAYPRPTVVAVVIVDDWSELGVVAAAVCGG